MLEHLPVWLGHALQSVRAGADALAITRGVTGEVAALELGSPAFGHGGRLPPRFTADGEGVSPPLVWSDPPEVATWMALLVEDADSPTPQPLVHAAVWGLAPRSGTLAEGAIVAEAAAGTHIGRNSFQRDGWLPPDPPSGHGEHRYAFQLFAMTGEMAEPDSGFGRTALLEAMAGHVIAAGILIGTYSRDEAAPTASIPSGPALA